jgi:hypothetical protein
MEKVCRFFFCVTTWYPSPSRNGLFFGERTALMKRIGRYEVIRRLGKGGMGSVYKALTPVIDKVVAIKLLDPGELLEDMVGTEPLREIFTFEARTMASFNQPFLVTAYDFDEDQRGRPYFVMEYICNNLGDMIGETFRIEEDSRGSFAPPRSCTTAGSFSRPLISSTTTPSSIGISSRRTSWSPMTTGSRSVISAWPWSRGSLFPDRPTCRSAHPATLRRNSARIPGVWTAGPTSIQRRYCCIVCSPASSRACRVFLFR